MKPFALILALLPLPAVACEPGEGRIFTCGFNDGRNEVSLCATDSAILYRFGRPDHAPDLLMHREFEDILYQPWGGIGRSIWESVTFTNGDYAYEIGMSLDKFEAVESNRNPYHGSISVQKKGAEIAFLTCDPDSASFAPFLLGDFYEAAGYCYERATQRWQRRCSD